MFAAGCDGGTDEGKKGAPTATESTTSSALATGPPCPRVATGQALKATGSVAFVAERRSGSELVAVDVGTEEVRRVTKQRTPHDGVTAFTWSPDAARIAYSGGTRGWNDKAYDDIWVVAADGGPPKRLTDSREDDWDPVWSPDGQRLAFDRQDDGYNWIYVVNADGTGLRRLTPNFSWDPAWTRDGHISYLRGNAIWVMNSDGSNKRVLARVQGVPNGVDVAWSPDGTHVASPRTRRSG